MPTYVTTIKKKHDALSSEKKHCRFLNMNFQANFPEAGNGMQNMLCKCYIAIIAA